MKAFASVIVLLILPFILLSCSDSENVEINIPEYPNAVDDQEHKAEMFGKDFGSVRRVLTTDSFDTVFNYFEENLQVHNPELISHTLDDGRQAAFTIMDTEKSSITVVVQEFKEDGKVAISYMNLNLGL